MHTGISLLDNLFTNPLATVFFLIGIIIAVTVHEFAHAYVAARQGDQTAKYLGRVSLNPLAHLDPAGSLLFVLAGIGWGKPVPVNPANLKDGRRGDFYVSIAGIVTNLVTAFIFTLPLQILHNTGGDISSVATSGNVGLLFCATVSSVNILLAAFNLLPFPPLDGSKALGILVPRRYDRQYEEYLRLGPVVLIGILVASFVFHLNILGPLIDVLSAAFGFLTFLPTSALGG